MCLRVRKELDNPPSKLYPSEERSNESEKPEPMDGSFGADSEEILLP